MKAITSSCFIVFLIVSSGGENNTGEDDQEIGYNFSITTVQTSVSTSTPATATLLPTVARSQSPGSTDSHNETTERVTSSNNTKYDSVTTKPDKNTGAISVHPGMTTTTAEISSDLNIPFGGFSERWIHVFMLIHHFDGTYIYDGGQYTFDFVVRYVSPTSSRVLVAAFYDEDGAVLELNGSFDGEYVIFVLTKVFSPGYRFPVDMEFTLTGSLKIDGYQSVYSGNITKPDNSSFETFVLRKEVDKPISDDENLTRIALIVAIPTCVAFVAIIVTISIICWAMKKGYLKTRDKSYRMFRNTAVTYDTEQETIHI